MQTTFKLRVVLEHSPAGVLASDPDNHILADGATDDEALCRWADALGAHIRAFGVASLMKGEK
ncbi:MAG: hypothetical protein KGL39_46855 [Patescibacteria group bacterium]|nr:hypothetical protein [Patescibacteria group bacterium]